jgi:phosphate starvation-inducible protein PhoH
MRHPVLRAFGQSPTEDQLRNMMAKVDFDNSNSIEFYEFLRMMAPTMPKDVAAAKEAAAIKKQREEEAVAKAKADEKAAAAAAEKKRQEEEEAETARKKDEQAAAMAAAADSMAAMEAKQKEMADAMAKQQVRASYGSSAASRVIVRLRVGIQFRSLGGTWKTYMYRQYLTDPLESPTTNLSM